MATNVYESLIYLFAICIQKQNTITPFFRSPGHLLSWSLATRCFNSKIWSCSFSRSSRRFSFCSSIISTCKIPVCRITQKTCQISYLTTFNTCHLDRILYSNRCILIQLLRGENTVTQWLISQICGMLRFIFLSWSNANFWVSLQKQVITTPLY